MTPLPSTRTVSIQIHNGRLSKLKEVIELNGFEIYKEEEKGVFTFIEARELEIISIGLECNMKVYLEFEFLKL
jgi:hypothetical protein